MSTTTAPTPVIRPTPQVAPTKKPSSAGYWLAAVVAILALAAAISWGAVATVKTLDRPDGFARGVVPGQISVPVADAGERIVYYEGDAQPSWQQLGLRVTSPGGGAMPVQTYDRDLRYDASGGHVAKAIASFKANGEGTYRVSASASADPGAKLAVGDDLSNSMKAIVFWAGIVVLGGAIAAAAIAASTYRRRSRESA